MHENRLYFLSLLSQNTIQLSDLTLFHCSPTHTYVTNAHFTSATVHERLQETLVYLRKQNLLYTWICGPLDRPASLSHHLKEYGLSADEFIGMYAHTHYIDHAYPIKRVTRLAEMRYFEQLHDFELLCANHSLFSNSNCELYVLFNNGEAVTTGIIVFYSGVAGIYYLATKLDERKKGFAHAMLSFLITRAYTRKYSYVVLQSPASLRHFYNKYSFNESCIFFEFS